MVVVVVVVMVGVVTGIGAGVGAELPLDEPASLTTCHVPRKLWTPSPDALWRWASAAYR